MGEIPSEYNKSQGSAAYTATARPWLNACDKPGEMSSKAFALGRIWIDTVPGRPGEQHCFVPSTYLPPTKKPIRTGERNPIVPYPQHIVKRQCLEEQGCCKVEEGVSSDATERLRVGVLAPQERTIFRRTRASLPILL
jgi:hypothetical protein